MADTEAIEYKVLAKSNAAVKELQDCMVKYTMPQKNPFSNIINQVLGGAYVSDSSHVVRGRGLDAIQTSSRNFTNPINEMFTLLEEVRKQGIVMHYSEKQYPIIPRKIIKVNIPKPNLASGSKVKPIPEVSLEGMEEEDDEEIEQDPLEEDIDDTASDVSVQTQIRIEYLNGEEMKKVYDPKQLAAFDQITHSALWLDFDVYQKNNTRIIDDMKYQDLVRNISAIIRDTLDFSSVINDSIVERIGGSLVLNMYVAVLRKPHLVACEDARHPGCYKDSFHIRFLTTRMNKSTKQYIRREILRKGFLQDIFANIDLDTDYETMLDENSLSNTAMFLGSAKKGSKIAHDLYKMFKVRIRQNGSEPTLETVKSFEPLRDPDEELSDSKPKRGKAAAKIVKPKKYSYNLCHELSLIYEAPNGLIKKRDFDPISRLANEIKSYSEQKADNILAEKDIANIDFMVNLLCERKPEARQIHEILKIIKPERLRDYDSWKDLVLTLAFEDIEYKPLAIWASQRCPEQWANHGLKTLEELWSFAAANATRRDTPYIDDSPGNLKSSKRTVATLYHWAKIDNHDAFRETQAQSAFMQLLNISLETGQPNETEIARCLKVMYGTRLTTDKQAGAGGSRRVWFAFNGGENPRTPGDNSLYKWRNEDNICDSLADIIANEFPKFVAKVITWIEHKTNDASLSADTIKWYNTVIANLNKWKRKLGDNATINKYIVTCGRVFREDGFIRKLDICEHVTGVGNGILNLGEVPGSKTELIQSYNKYYITRSCNADWIPFDLSNPWVDMIQMKVRELFWKDEDAYEFTMCFLCSTLDGRRKSPIFFIWLGEGANGKSFLLEFHIKVMGDCTREGYGFKMNSVYFTSQDRGGGPNTEKMQLKYARFAYCSETKPGDQLQTDKIKEMLGGETISGNEKFQKQENFEVNARFVMCSNYDPVVVGNDYGIWRRLRVYIFKMCFKDHPDPENPQEKKIDSNMLEVWPKDSRFKQAYLSFMTKWYEKYRDVYKFKLSDIPHKTILNESREYQLKQDLIGRFVYQSLEFVGASYEVLRDDDTAETVQTTSIQLHDLASAYTLWHKKWISDSPPNSNEVLRQLKMIPQIKKHLQRAGHMEMLANHVLHPVGKAWTARKPYLDPLHGEKMVDTNRVGTISLDLKADEAAYESIQAETADAIRQMLEEEPPEPVDIKDIHNEIPDMDEDPLLCVRDDENDSEKKRYPEFNRPAVNKRLGIDKPKPKPAPTGLGAPKKTKPSAVAV